MLRWMKRIALGLAVCCVVIGLGAAYVLHQFSRQDARNLTYLECGRSINHHLEQYATALQQSFDQQEPDHVLQLYSAGYSSPGRGQWRLGNQRDIGNVVLSDLTRADSRDYDQYTLRDEISAYLQDLTAIDQVWCKIELIEHAEPGFRAQLTVKYILDGKDRQGRLLQDRFFFRWWLEHESGDLGDGGWRITRDELVEGVRVAGRANGLVRLPAEQSGIDFVHQRDPKLNKNDPDIGLRFAVIEHASGGVSAVDYDDDGHPDIFFADGRRCRLYKNSHDDSDEGSTANVRFEDVTVQSGLDGIGHAHSGLFFDLDNDGDKDLFIARYLVPCKFYRNRGDGTFVDCSTEVGLDLVAPSVSACCLDYDADGFADLYVGINGNAFAGVPKIPFFAKNGVPNRLYRNVDGKRFVDVTEQTGTGNTGWTLAVSAGDFDRDGDSDLGLANDFGRKVLLRNNGDGTFTDVAKKAGVLDFSGGMGLAFGDFNDDGLLDLYTSNINSNQRWYGEETTIRQYTRNMVRTKWIFDDFQDYRELYGLLEDRWPELGKMMGEGNSLFYNQGDGSFRELKDSHTNKAGWSWGVALLDVDNDTDLDIYVANGWISGKIKNDL